MNNIRIKLSLYNVENIACNNMDKILAYGIIVLMGIGCFLIGFCFATILYYCNGVQQRRELLNIERSIMTLRDEYRPGEYKSHSEANQKHIETVPLVERVPPGDDV